MKLQTLRPRLSTILTQRIPTQHTDRLRGRAAVDRRARWLRDHPLCCMCEAEGVTRAATVPDHIIALTNGGPDDESNLQSLCTEHHRRKTEQDMGYRHKPKIGLDGWPE